MTDNDYIAEYVKKKHPGILGFDYAMWRMARSISEMFDSLTKTLSRIDWNTVKARVDEIESYIDDEDYDDDEDEEEDEYE